MKINKGPDFQNIAKGMSPANPATLNKAALEKNPEILKNAVTNAKSLLGSIASPPAGHTGVNKVAVQQLESSLSHIAQMVSVLQV